MKPRPMALLVAFNLLASAGPGQGFTALYAFGDSLTDTDSLAAWLLGYYDFQFSNGRLWVEYLSPALGFSYSSANNYAVAGDVTADTITQANSLAAPGNAATSLFAVWAGGNDFLDNLGAGTNDSSWSNLTRTAVGNLSNAVNILYSKGARTFMVPNLPDLGRTPRLINGYSPAFQVYLRGKVVQFNSALLQMLDSYHQTHPAATIFNLDIFSRMAFIVTNLNVYGFTVADIGARDDPSLADKSFTGPGSSYVFWDNIHPTSKAHRLIADWALETLASTQRVAITFSRASTLLNLNLSPLQTARTYVLQTTTNFLDWQDSVSFPATNIAQTLSLPLANPRAFCRVKY